MKNINQILTCTIGIVILSLATSQAQITFQKSFSSGVSENAIAGAPTPDSGFVVIGWSSGFTASQYDMFVTKYNKAYNVEWTKLFVKSGYESAIDVITTTDGDYVIAGYASSVALIMKLDKNGNLLWANTQGINNTDKAQRIQETSDKGFIMAGYIIRDSTDWDISVKKLDSLGNLQWSKIIYTDTTDLITDIIQTPQNEYVIAGYTRYGTPAKPTSSFLIKLDSIGNILWGNTYVIDSTMSLGNTIIVEANGNIIFTGSGQDAFILTVDGAGNVIKISSYGNFFTSGKVILKQNNKYYIGGGTFNLGYANSTFCLAQIDTSGILDWYKVYGTMGEDVMKDMIQLANGDIVFIGTTKGLGPGSFNGYLVITDSLGYNSCYIDTVQPYSFNHVVDVYAVPFMDTSINAVVNIPVFTFQDTTFIDTIVCFDCKDCVWPGDANNDGIANVWDVLSIGVGYGETGPQRFDPTIKWFGQIAEDWPKFVSDTSRNYRYIDCDGNGSINANDIDAITANYGMQHSTSKSNAVYNEANPDLYFEIISDDVAPGTNVDIAIMAGRDSLSDLSMYGYAFCVQFDNTLIESGSMNVQFTNSWVYKDTSSLSIYEVDHTNGLIDIGFSKVDHNNSNGKGRIATLTFDIAGSIGTSSDTIIKYLLVSFCNATIIDTAGAELPVNVFDKSIKIIQPPPTGIKKFSALQNKIQLYPNPALDEVQIEFGDLEVNELSVYDMVGARLKTVENISTQQISLDLTNVAPGMYFLKVAAKEGKFGKRLTVVK
ncbi:T9SS type A sorting domain-containing protein [bacterium AH-315-C07]|nr:T9SS type A sorting domain-containing protein [bacterium AH-315-C07]